MIRDAFSRRLNILSDHFMLLSVSLECAAVQLMNEFPKWTKDELLRVAEVLSMDKTTLENLYLRSWKIIRERHLEDALADYRMGRGSKPSQLDGAIPEIDGNQHWEPPKKKDNKGPGDWMSDDEMEAFFRKHENADAFKDYIRQKIFENEKARQSPPESSYGYGDGGTRSRSDQKSDSSAGYGYGNVPHEISGHLTTLKLLWPVTMEEVKTRHRRLAKESHPDRKGNVEEFKRIQNAFEQIKKYFEKHA